MPLVTKARKIDPVLRGVTSKFTKYEQEIYNIYVRALSQMPKDLDNDLVRRAIREAIEAGNPMDGAFGFQWNNFLGSLDKSIPTLANQLAASANISAKALPKAIQISSSFTATDPRAIAWAQQRAGARILGITQESQKAVAETITRGLQGQLTRDEVIEGVTRVVGLDSRQAKALGTFYEKNLNLLLEQGLTYENAARAAKKLGEKYRSRLIKQRATRIARTETNAAANAGRMLSWAEADIQGLLPVGSEKRWKTSQDERNCPTCRPMHNETVPWEGAFSTGDIMPPVHINCLCTAVIVPADPVFEKSLYTTIKKTRKTAWLFVKHGSHNQKTHGRGGSGGGAGVDYPTVKSNPELKDAIRDYVAQYPRGAGHQDINKTLRKQPGYDNVTPDYQDKIDSRVAALDKLVELSPPLSEQTTVYRGIGTDFARELEAAGVGGSFTDNGFTSVSLNKEIAGGFPSMPTGNLIEITLPAGTKAINPSRFFGENMVVGNTNLSQEQELILGRGTTFDILEIVDNVALGVGKIIRVGVKSE